MTSTEFEEEAVVYRDRVLSSTLPAVLYATDNSDCRFRSRSGFVFPPFLVVERGITLGHWATERRSVFDVIAMVENVASLVDSLHQAGYVHRDLCVPRQARRSGSE